MADLLNPDTGLMFWTIVTFLALVAILKFAAWGPLLHAVEAREARIKADREGAEKARADKKALVATNMALTEGEAKAFWPLYDEYQKGLADLNTRNLKAIVDFAQAQQKPDAVAGESAKKLIEDMLAADGYIFVCPENLAAIAGVMKAFFDRCYYPVLGRIEGRPYAQMVCAGTDGENAVRQIARIATGWRLKAMAEPIIVVTHADTPEAILAPKTIGPTDLARCAETARALAAGLDMGIF